MASTQCRVLKLIKSNCNPNSILRHFSSVRERTGFNPGFNSSSEKDNGRSAQNPPQPIPNRPLRGGNRPPYQPQSQSHPNKPSRGGKPQSQLQSRPPPNPRNPRNGRFSDSTPKKSQLNNDYNPSNDDFLEKFKLRLNKKDKENEIENSNPNNPPLSDNQETDSPNSPDSPDSPPPDANEIFQKMKETGLIPNAVAMLDGLCKDGLVQDAMKLFGSMREKGTIPEVVVYTAVVDGFCRARKSEDAIRIFRKMIDNGITPNAYSYTVIVQGLCRCNSIDDAVDFCNEMVGSGFSPNVATFVGLVEGLCRYKGVEEARGVIEGLKKKGFFVNEKSVREFLDKNASLNSPVWEVVLGRKQPLPKPF